MFLMQTFWETFIHHIWNIQIIIVRVVEQFLDHLYGLLLTDIKTFICWLSLSLLWLQIGWEHKKVIDLVKENPMTVTLTLRKRPKNLSTPGQFQRVSQNSFPIYGPRIRPAVQEKQHSQRSRKNSDPTTLIRVVSRDKEEACEPRR